MDREQFTFYASFAQAIQRIEDLAERALAYDALVNYALTGEAPDLDTLPAIVAIVFELTKPNLDASRKKAENGKRGGTSEANTKQTPSKPEANAKQTGSKKEKEDKKESKKEKENKCSPLISPQRGEEMIRERLSDRSEELMNAVSDWLKYKTERKEAYRETGFTALLSQIENNARTHSDREISEVIYRTMSANYQGIVFDWLNKKPRQTLPRSDDLSSAYAMMEAWANG